MASRRPTIRSYSANGRSGSQNGDNAPSPRLDSRNYLSSVRPENRSTFCSVMSQLAEETQPCFETTIKSKAVSEACNVKFTCVVTGYPVPELTWYKDDMELDRYCGLPKYEIFRSGKTHTLHIYNCSVDDAAIYQASARNSKGIVSCSGVLEVGSMSEYKIHQRFFAKLKQKAVLKQRELQESQRQDKENVQQEQLGANQDHTLKKLRLFESPDHNFPSILDGEDNVNHVETILHDAAALDDEFNDLSVKAPISQIRSNINKENISQQMGSDISHSHNRDQQLDQVSEKAEIDGIPMFTKEKVSKNKIRVCNGFDNINQSHQGAGDLKDTYEGLSLAKFLTESLQSQTDKEHQKNTIQSQELISTDTNNIQEKELNSMKDKVTEHKKADIHQKQESSWERHKVDEAQESCWEREPEKSKKREQEKSKLRERERSKEREKSKERDRETLKKREQEITKERERENRKQIDHEHKAVAVSDPKAPPHKDPDHQHKSAFSSVFHSLKDIFFGKSKKIPETTDSLKKVSEMDIAKEIPVPNEAEHPHLSETQPQEPNTTPGINGAVPDPSVIMEEGQHHQTGDLDVTGGFPQESPPLLQISVGMMNLNLDAHADEATDGDQIYNVHEIHKNVDTRVENSQEKEEVNRVEEEAGPRSLPKILLCEATDDHREAERDESMFDLPHETPARECSVGMDQMTQASEEMHAVKERDTPDFIQRPSVCLPGPNRTDLEGTESNHEAQLSQPISHASFPILSKFEKNEEISMDKNRAECKTLTEDTRDPDVEEIPGQNSQNTEEECSLTEGHKDKINVETVGTTLSIQNSVTEMLETVSLFDRAHGPDTNFLDKSTPELNMNLSVTPQNESIMGKDLKQNKISASVLVIEAVSVGNDMSTERNTCTVKNRGKSTETKKTDNTEIKKEQSENTEDNGTKERITGDNTNITLQQVTTYNAVEPGFSKNKNKPEIEGTETHLSVRQSKSKIYSKAQPESPQMIILPDTRETVIKNVAKMRATPLTPEIKVTTPEKVRYDEPVNVPKLDGILPEPGKVEVACTAGDNELPMGDEKRASNETSREGNIVNSAEPIGVTPVQQEMNVVCIQLGQKKQEVTSHSIETTVSGTEESPNTNSGQSRGNDNTIPTISIASADEVTEDVHEKSSFLETDNVTCSSTSTVCAQSTEIISIKRELAPDSLAIILKKAVGNLDHETNPSSKSGPEKAALQVEQNMSEGKNCVETQLIPDVTSPPLSKAPNITQTDTVIICSGKELKMEPDFDRIQREKPAMEKLGLTTPVGPTLPPLSPASLRRLMAKNNPNLESQGSVPAVAGDGSDKKGEDSGSSTPTSILSCESSPKMKRRDSLTLIPSATPEELASGARRKIYLAKTKSEDEASDSQSKRDMSPSQARRAAFLLQSGQQTPPLEKRSPLMGRRKNTLEVPKPKEEPSEETDRSNTEKKTEEKEKQDPYKAPQVIRKIRGEPFSDALGHLKLWCQFFNVLSDSTIMWFKDEVQIAEMKRSAGDESQVALAIVQASSRDCGVYGCTIKNEYGRDSTDFLLSPEILSEFFLRDDLEVGEEIEMTPLLFTKGLADPGYWGDKFFGRIMTEAVHIGEGCTHKSSRAKVIYGLDPVFESGSTCIVKVRNSIVYGTKEENNLAERNLEIAKQECKIQNTVREYCKIFAAEARVSDAFGFSLEVIPLYLMYRPANTIPYATVEANLKGLYLKYSLIDSTGERIPRTLSEVEQKCSTFQHWILQWTNGNLLVTQLEGVDTKITNIRIASKSKGYQGLAVEGSPKVLEQFMSQHQCNYYCGLLGLRPLMPTDSLQQPKVKTSKSPLLARRVGIASSANQQLQKKGSSSPQAGRKCNASPKVAKKTNDDGENKSATKHKTAEVTKTVRME